MHADHYFSQSPSAPETRTSRTVSLGGRVCTVSTASGVFSGEGVDRGTAVLLREAPAPTAGAGDAVLDLGCGWGVIALDTALRCPEATVWAVDVNERALELTRDNAAALGLDNVRVAIPDGVPDGVRFAEIRSNPPIRVGKAQLHELLLRWLPRLAPGGTAYLVVAKHLGAPSLQRWLADTLGDTHEVSRAARDKGFHVIAVTAHRA